MGVDVMRPAFNIKPKYRVKMLTREDLTKRTDASPVVKGLVWFIDGVQDEGGEGGQGLQSIGNL
jgi:hypothetical protein